MTRLKHPRAAAAPKVSRREKRDQELARLIREQREDDTTELRRTVLGDVLRGVGVCLDDDRPTCRPSRYGVDCPDDDE
jgi:hypothetical protein